MAERIAEDDVRPNLPAAVETSRSAGRIRQLASHRDLLRDVSRDVEKRPKPATRRQRLDAIVVPTARGADQLARAVQLAADAEILLVVLGSQLAQVGDVAAQVAKVPGSRALIVDVPEEHAHE